MPDIDGFKFTTLIKSVESVWRDEISKLGDIRRSKIKKNCPIVAVTAFNSESVNTQASKVGILRVL